MKLYNHLYVGTLTDKAVEKYKKKIRKRKPAFGLFVITLPIFPSGILEIYSYNELLQPFYKKHSDNIMIIGMAEGYEAAVEIVTSMIDEMYQTSKELDVQKFLGTR